MSLYLEKCLPYLRKAFVKVGFIHCHPYSWSDSRGQPAVNRKRWARTHWYLNVAVIFTYCAFVVCRTTQVFLCPSASLAKKFYMAFVSLYYMLAALVSVTVVTTRKDFVPFLRGFITFLQDGETRFSETRNNCGSLRCNTNVVNFQRRPRAMDWGWEKNVK